MKRLVIFSGIFFSLIMEGHSIGFRIDFIENRNTYLMGEPLILKCELYNTGSDTQYIDIDDIARMIIINSKGDTLKANLKIFKDYIGGGKPLIPLPPRDTIYDVFNFINWYGEPLPCDIPHCRGIIPADEYTIKIWNYVPKRLQDVAKRNKKGEFLITKTLSSENCDVIESNTIRMKIEEPTGREKEAWEILKEIYKRVKRGAKNIEEIKKLLNEYADTRYAPAVFESFIVSSLSSPSIQKYRSIYGKQDKVEIAKEFLKRYPNSGVGAFLSSPILDDCYKNVEQGKYDKAMKIYNEMLKKYKGTPVGWGIRCSKREMKWQIRKAKFLRERGWKR